MTYTLTDNQKRIFDDRYALKDEKGNQLETKPEEMWYRVSQAIADNEQEANEFYRILHGFKFVPGGRILAGAGAETEKTFYNCYVIPIEPRNVVHSGHPGRDSREAIFETMERMVSIMSRGGGVGINFSTLRPSGSYLTRVSGTSSGPVGWMHVFSTAVGEVEQGGSRRGAAMFMLDDWHPNVLDFIKAKQIPGRIENANVSVAISNSFMKAVEDDDDWTTRFPDTKHEAYDKEWDGDLREWERKGYPIVAFDTRSARQLWRAIADSAHASGEPGVVFLERYNDESTAGDIERLISVNPCGEQGLGAYSVCNLGSMNLDKYAFGGSTWIDIEGEPYYALNFDWQGLGRDVRTAIRFLDNVIDTSYYFLPETRRQQKRLRRVGLGVMGLADALVRLKLRYGSEEAIKFTADVFQTMKDVAIIESMRLARDKNHAQGWDASMMEKPFLKEFLDRNPKYAHEMRQYGMRNLFLLTQAPTGTTAMFADVNSGIEPYFSLKTWREDRTGGRYVFAKAVDENLYNHVMRGDLAPWIVESKDVTVEEHLAMQAAVQKYVDSSVSKTVNAPKEQTIEETQQVFDLAWQTGLKGIAYYRDGSRTKQVLYNEDPNVKVAELERKVKDLEAKMAYREKVERWTDVGLPASLATLVPYQVMGSSSVTFAGHDTNCKGKVVFEEGCTQCRTCSWAAC